MCMEGKFYTVKEFAKKLQVSEHIIRRSIREGRIHAFRPGVGIKRGAYRIYESEFTRIMMVDFATMKKERGEMDGK